MNILQLFLNMNNLLNVPENLVTALGWALLHSLWQGVLLVAALSLLVRKRRTATRYALGIGALATQVVAFGLTLALVYEPTVTLPEPVLTTSTGPVDYAAPFVTPDLAISWLDRLESVLPALVLVWLIGTAVLGLRLAGGWLLVRQWTRRGIQTVPASWQHHVDRLSRELGVRRPVRLLESARVMVPMTVGWLKPVILIPVGLLTHLSPQQVEAVLAHELAHIRRHDYLINFLQSVAEVLFFYHPAIWYLSSRVREEREHLCDEAAIALTGRPLEYAQTLAAVENLRLAVQPRLALAFGGTKSQLLERVKRVLGVAEEPTQNGLTGLVLAAGLLLIAGLTVAQRVPQPTELVPMLETSLHELVVEEPDPADDARSTPDTTTPPARKATTPRVVGTPPDSAQVRRLKEEMRRREDAMEQLGEKMEQAGKPMEALGEQIGRESKQLERVGQRLSKPSGEVERLGEQIGKLAESLARKQLQLEKLSGAQRTTAQQEIARQQVEMNRLQTRLNQVIQKEMEPVMKEMQALQSTKMAGLQDSLRVHAEVMAKMAAEQAVHAAEFRRAFEELKRVAPGEFPEPAIAPAAPRAPRSPKGVKAPRLPRPVAPARPAAPSVEAAPAIPGAPAPPPARPSRPAKPPKVGRIPGPAVSPEAGEPVWVEEVDPVQPVDGY